MVWKFVDFFYFSIALVCFRNGFFAVILLKLIFSRKILAIVNNSLIDEWCGGQRPWPHRAREK